MNDLYILKDGEESGPFELRELEAMIQNGELPAETLYARPGMAAWQPLSSVVSVNPVVAAGSAAEPDATTEDEVPELPKTNYDSSAYESLMAEFKCLSTYEAVDEWDSRAQEEVSKMVQVIRGLGQAIARESGALAQARLEFQQRSFLKRTFGKHDQEDVIVAQMSNLNQRKFRLLQWVAQLQEAIDFTPNTPAEKEVLAKELRHRKKELQAEKREATANMTAIRREARVRSVTAGKTWLGLYDSGLAADQRRGIRYAKEAALRPHEDAKAAIERQLVKVERDLLWVEQFP